MPDINFKPDKLSERLYRKIIDNRITTTATVEAVGKNSQSLVTVIYYAKWQKAIYVLGRRIK